MIEKLHKIPLIAQAFVEIYFHSIVLLSLSLTAIIHPRYRSNSVLVNMTVTVTITLYNMPLRPLIQLLRYYLLSPFKLQNPPLCNTISTTKKEENKKEEKK